MMLGIKNYQFRFRSKFNLDLPYELKGTFLLLLIMIDTTVKIAGKQRRLISIAIGQGEITVTPIQLANFMQLS